MTIEHRILTLLDRGLSWSADLRDAVGPGVLAYLDDIEREGMALRSGEDYSLTAAGLARLNLLDDLRSPPE